MLLTVVTEPSSGSELECPQVRVRMLAWEIGVCIVTGEWFLHRGLWRKLNLIVWMELELHWSVYLPMATPKRERTQERERERERERGGGGERSDFVLYQNVGKWLPERRTGVLSLHNLTVLRFQ